MSLDKLKKLPLRIGAGVVLLNPNNQVFVGKRIDNPVNFWQMPQGGVKVNEDFAINTANDNQLNFAIKLFNG